jgi:hypothetical protein
MNADTFAPGRALSATERRDRYRALADEARGRRATLDAEHASQDRLQAAHVATAWDRAWYACLRHEVSAHEATLVAEAEAWQWCATPPAHRSSWLETAVALAKDYNLCSDKVEEHQLVRAIIDAVATGRSALDALIAERPALERALRVWDELYSLSHDRYVDYARRRAAVQTIGTLNIIDDGEDLGWEDAPGVDREASLLRFAAVVEQAVRETLPEWRIGHVEIGPRAHAVARQAGWDYDPRLDADPHADTREVKVQLAHIFARVATEQHYVDQWLVESTDEA